MVVNNQNLVTNSVGCEPLTESTYGWFNGVGFVVSRDDDGEFHYARLCEAGFMSCDVASTVSATVFPRRHDCQLGSPLRFPWERTHPAFRMSGTLGTLEACAPGDGTSAFSASLR